MEARMRQSIEFYGFLEEASNDLDNRNVADNIGLSSDAIENN